MISARIALVFALALTCAGIPECARAFYWPDPYAHPRVILQADQDITQYESSNPDWFKNDFLIAGLYVKGIVYGDANDGSSLFINLLNASMFGGVKVGTTISGTTAIHEAAITHFPDNAASIEDMSVKVRYLGPWMRDPVEQVVDLSDAFSRASLEASIVGSWRHIPVSIHFVDNAAVHHDVYPLQKWDLYCANMKALRAAAEILGDNVIFNVFVRPWQMSDAETQQLIDAVAGNHSNAIALPLPWSKALNDDKKANGWAIYRYCQLLDSGIVLILIPSADASQADLYKWLATWRRPGDRIYMGVPFWEEPPEP